MAEPTEPRALGAALAAPAFVTKAGGGAMHAAMRHVERWAPEAHADRSRPLRNLSFVDRLVSPWIEAAQRSASLRLFSQYRSSGMPERPTTQTSWLFPRPWYQDELDWMASARQVNQVSDSESSPTMLTTRGTYVAPSAMSMPTALYEFVAPSLSVARNDAPMSSMSTMSTMSSTMSRAAIGPNAYSPLVPLAAVQAAHVAQRALAPLGMSTAERMSPGLRSVLATMLQRTAMQAAEPSSTRLAASAPELVTPPAPRAAIAPTPIEPAFEGTANELGAQHAQLIELQRAARAIATRELAARQAPVASASASASSSTPPAAVSAPSRTVDEALEARIAQRLAERRTEEQQHAIERTVTARREQRLHDAARESAARDARNAFAATPAAPSASASASASAATIAAPAPMQRRVPDELVHAIGALSPALAATVAATIAREPDRAAQTIEELTDALRTVELLARATAAGNTFESTRGPRLVMPAGLGGLVASVERTTPSAPNAPMTGAMTGAAAAPTVARPMGFATPSIARAMRVPAMPALSGPTSFGRPAALAAAEVAKPAALQHVAWADRWLARFSGARKESLDVFAASATPAALESRLAALAAGAPDSVFVAPTAGPSASRIVGSDAASAIAQAPAQAPAVMRFDDNAETPDDVFASIAAAARNARVEQSTARADRATRTATPAVETSLMTMGIERETFADVVAHAVPAAPHAGFSAQLASSPFAPALRHVLPLAAAPSFDVRALFGDSLVATYLAGLMSPATRELAIDAPAPVWSTLGEPTTAASVGDDVATARPALEWDAAYVAPGLEPTAAPTAAPTAETSETALTTMRSALLAWNVETDATGALVASPQPQQPTSVARSMALAMALPMIGELAAASGAVGLARAGGEATPGTSYAAPGMIADRAHTWSVAQERSASDLALDFVTPELVLAARVYGLGPAEAAQAARLAIAGPGALATMASTVDRTFVQALAIEAERRERAQVVTAYPTAYPHEDAAQVAQRAATGAPITSAQAPAMPAPIAAAPMPAATTFGVDRRTPRGAFMWPSATVAALGLNAASPDGEQSMSVAALELLAAQAVAELGTYAALGERPAARDDVATAAGTDAAHATTTASAQAATIAAQATSTSTSTSTSTFTSTSTTADAAIRASEPSDHDMLATAAAMVPTARRAKLEALYVALSQSSTARSWSPAARAARALALAGRGDETISAHERASIAWDVLPVVAPIASMRGDEAGEAERFAELAPGATRSTGLGARQSQMTKMTQATQGGGRRDGLALPDYIELRPGLAGLSARAGEALGSYVAPTVAPGAPASAPTSAREVGAVLRAPTAAQEMVRTGRPSGRFGGGEVEIPTWFEAAARKMFDERSSGGPASELSLADLTLIAAAPAAQVAASTRSMPGAAPANPNPSSAGEQSTSQSPIDVEKIANEVYRQILVLMDAARFRNGEPYL
jgi:hypothetical protein